MTTNDKLTLVELAEEGLTIYHPDEPEHIVCTGVITLAKELEQARLLIDRLHTSGAALLMQGTPSKDGSTVSVPNRNIKSLGEALQASTQYRGFA